MDRFNRDRPVRPTFYDGYKAQQVIGAARESQQSGKWINPFIMPDGNTLYFFFTPDLSIPAEQQLLDGVTGIYVSRKANGTWGELERVLLQDPGKLAMDGCAFVAGDTMWICTARERLTGIHWFTAQWFGVRWQNWQPANFDPAYQMGELHFSRDGAELYYHADRPGGEGELDIWVSRQVNGVWQEPEQIVSSLAGEPSVDEAGIYISCTTFWRMIR